MYYIYILQSELNDELYTGSTNNLKKRFQEHNDSKVFSTKRYKPWKLLYYEAYQTEKLARMREKRLKYNGNAMKELKKRIGFSSVKSAFKVLKSGAGFTIVELLVYMGLLSILLGVLTSVFMTSLDVQLESQANSAVEQDGSYILSKLAYDIHRAESITIPVTLGGQTANFQIVVNTVNYTYSIDADNNLVLQEGLGAGNNLNGYGTSIASFSAQRLGNAGKVEDTLNIGFTITSRTRKDSGYETKNFQTNLSLRRQ